MLIFTNRTVDAAATDASAFTTRFVPFAPTLGLASVAPAGGGWRLDGVRADAGDDTIVTTLVALFRGVRPVLVYLHGNNNTPSACFRRCDRLAAIYGVEVIGFSWPSEGLLSTGEDAADLSDTAADLAQGEANLSDLSRANRTEGPFARKARRYLRAKTNAQESADALARFLRLLATARLFANARPLTLAAHSLGAHLLEYSIDVDGAAAALGATTNLALLAPCVRASGHRVWISRLSPTNQLFVTFNRGDSVLFGARVVDANQVKLGADPGADRLVAPYVRYVDFTGAAEGDLGGHGYFVADAGDKVPKRARKLFGRIFSAEHDIADGEPARKVYAAGCDADGLTCYMAQPPNPDGID